MKNIVKQSNKSETDDIIADVITVYFAKYSCFSYILIIFQMCFIIFVKELVSTWLTSLLTSIR
jgi:hypothetical protein